MKWYMYTFTSSDEDQLDEAIGSFAKLSICAYVLQVTSIVIAYYWCMNEQTTGYEFPV